jgi:hypothetical protein
MLWQITDYRESHIFIPEDKRTGKIQRPPQRLWKSIFQFVKPLPSHETGGERKEKCCLSELTARAKRGRKTVGEFVGTQCLAGVLRVVQPILTDVIFSIT